MASNSIVLRKYSLCPLEGDNVWTSVEHAMARMAFEVQQLPVKVLICFRWFARKSVLLLQGIISLNALMVDGPWFHAVSAQRRAKAILCVSAWCCDVSVSPPDHGD